MVYVPLRWIPGTCWPLRKISADARKLLAVGSSGSMDRQSLRVMIIDKPAGNFCPNVCDVDGDAAGAEVGEGVAVGVGVSIGIDSGVPVAVRVIVPPA